MTDESMKAMSPKRWGAPLVWIDKHWTAVEARLCLGVLVAEILALFLWISLKGLKSTADDAKGFIFRAMVLAALFCALSHWGVKWLEKRRQVSALSHGVVVTICTALGIVVGRILVGKGVSYFENVFNWLQVGSSLYLVKGIKGLVTRLTLWLALLGASLATAKGKHINIDVLVRFLPAKARVPAAIASWLAAGAVCIAGAIGFVDYLAVAEYDVIPQACKENPHGCEQPPSVKMSKVAHEVGTDLFLLGRQITLDFKSLPKVVSGQKWDGYLSSAEWNDWLRGSADDWAQHLGKEKADGLYRPADATGYVLPRVPAKEGLLIKDLSFVFPFGLFMIGLRFFLRILLLLSGHVSADTDAAHSEGDLQTGEEGEAA
jgi:hypothetical protein